MKLMIGHLVLIFCMIGSPSWSVMADLIKPKSVYQAAYCAELLRLNRLIANDEVSKKITKAAATIIGGGDNIEFAQLGIEDARRKVLASVVVSRKVLAGVVLDQESADEITTNLQECANSLTEDLRGGNPSCGSGRGTSSEEDVKKYLTQLGLPLPYRYKQPEIKVSLWASLRYRVLSLIDF